jgi:hypothetical protein
MLNQPEWLPALILFENCAGDWERYLRVIYAYFKQDFIDSRPEYRGTRLGLKRHPVVEGKEATFWHVISEGSAEEDRLPDLRRCERIRWPRPVIEHADELVIKIWENERKGEKRINLWLENQEYLVVLAVRKTYILLWTAFPVTQPHRKALLQKEYEAFKKAGAAP